MDTTTRTYDVITMGRSSIDLYSNDVGAVVPYSAPVAHFSASATAGVAPLALNFTSTSTGTISTYAWTFGDGGTSAAQNPSHVYPAAGTYSVSLTVTGPGGNNTQTNNNYIAVAATPPVAAFTASIATGTAPLMVAFTSTSTGTIASYAWAFGDGGSSTAQNPSHLYLVAGAYTVGLTVTGPGGSNTQTRSNYILVSPPPGSTQTVLSSSTNPSQFGAPVAFLGTVTGAAPTGSVSFTDGGNTIAGCGSLALAGSGNSRTATCSAAGLALGTHSIVATYGGNGGNTASSSATLSQLVSSSANIGVLVDHYYQAILGRAADPGGEAYWESEAIRMQSLGVDVKEAFMVMAGYFFSSAEYLSLNTSDAQYVNDLYNTFFNRPPDPGGLSYWTGQLAVGLPRSIVMYGFLFSPEFDAFMTGLFGNTSSRAEVNAVVDFYRGILNRLPDTTGFNSFLTQFRSAQCAGAGSVYSAVDQISSSFLYSAEYLGRNRTNAEYVGDLYYAFLRRGGDLAGVNYWINRLASEAETRGQLQKDFINTPEFSGRVNAIIAQGCLSQTETSVGAAESSSEKVRDPGDR